MANEPDTESSVLNFTDSQADLAAGRSLMTRLGIDPEQPPRIAIQCTAGIDQYILERAGSVLATCSLADLTGFEHLNQLDPVKGHALQVKLVLYNGYPILLLCGRIHLYQGGEAVKQMVRRQVAMLAQIGVQVVITTSAVGSCVENVNVSDITAVVDMQRLTALTCDGAEGFPACEEALNDSLLSAALALSGMKACSHWFWPSGTIENPNTKRGLHKSFGVHIIGCSGQDAMEVVARYRKAKFNISGLMLGLVTNGLEHDHEAVLQAMDLYGEHWAGLVLEIVDHALAHCVE